MRQLLVLIAVAALLFGCVNNQPSTPPLQPYPAAGDKNAPMPGSDRDSHGCIPSAGYTWCEALQKCIRLWETNCTAAPAESGLPKSIGGESDSHGCIAAAGQRWCAAKNDCVGPTEQCTIEEYAKSFCGTAGYTVSICGNYIKYAPNTSGSGAAFYNYNGAKKTSCPTIAPDLMSPECRQLFALSCDAKKVC